jgi:hypothetical protein
MLAMGRWCPRQNMDIDSSDVSKMTNLPGPSQQSQKSQQAVDFDMYRTTTL